MGNEEESNEPLLPGSGSPSVSSVHAKELVVFSYAIKRVEAGRVGLADWVLGSKPCTFCIAAATLTVSLFLQSFSLATFLGATACGDKLSPDYDTVNDPGFNNLYAWLIGSSALFSMYPSFLDADKVYKVVQFTSSSANAQDLFPWDIRTGTCYIRFGFVALMLGSITTSLNLASRIEKNYPKFEPTMQCWSDSWHVFVRDNFLNYNWWRSAAASTVGLLFTFPQKYSFYMRGQPPLLGIMWTSVLYSIVKVASTISVNVILGKKTTTLMALELALLTLQRAWVYIEQNRLVCLKAFYNNSEMFAALGKVINYSEYDSSKLLITKFKTQVIDISYSLGRPTLSGGAQLLAQVFSMLAAVAAGHWTWENLYNIGRNVGLPEDAKYPQLLVAAAWALGRYFRFSSTTDPRNDQAANIQKLIGTIQQINDVLGQESVVCQDSGQGQDQDYADTISLFSSHIMPELGNNSDTTRAELEAGAQSSDSQIDALVQNNVLFVPQNNKYTSSSYAPSVSLLRSNK
jgi:hypothetical protein